MNNNVSKLARRSYLDAVGTGLTTAPRTDPGVPDSGTGLLSWVGDGKAGLRPRVEDAGQLIRGIRAKWFCVGLILIAHHCPGSVEDKPRASNPPGTRNPA
jgi:hypothetical protein